MSGAAIERRIFVVGVPRSGTTLLQSMLATHSELTSFTESHFFSRHYARLPLGLGSVLRHHPGARVAEFVHENGAASSDAANALARLLRKPAVRLAPPLLSRRVGRTFVALLDELALQRGVAGWVEKTPAHVRHIDLIDRLADDPRPRFVHVIREGLEVVSSLLVASKGWERAYDLDTCIARWNDDVALSVERLGSPRHHFVFYEQLTADPEATLRELLEALELPWEPQVVDRYGDTSARLVTDDETWKQGVGRAVRRSHSAAERLDDDQIRRAARALRSDLYELLRATV